jgi:hypothetical protein
LTSSSSSFFPTHAVDESDELDAKRGEVGAQLDDEIVKGHLGVRVKVDEIRHGERKS